MEPPAGKVPQVVGMVKVNLPDAFYGPVSISKTDLFFTLISWIVNAGHSFTITCYEEIG